MSEGNSQIQFKDLVASSLYYLVPAWATAITLLVLASAASLINILPGFLKLNNVNSSFNIGSFRQVMLEKLDRIPHIVPVVNFVFWLIAGIFVYLLSISIFSLISTARNDIDEVQHYLFPSTTKRTSVTLEIFIHWILFFSAILLLLILLFLTIFVVLPFSRELFLMGFRYPHSVAAWAKTLVSSLILGMAIGLSAFLFKLIWRTYETL